MKKRIKKIIAFAGMIALVGATLTGCAQVKMSNEEYQKAIDSAKVAAEMEGMKKGFEQGVIEGQNSVDITSDNQEVIDQAISGLTAEKEAEIARLNLLIEDAKIAEEEVEEETAKEGYDLDELEIGAEFDFTLTDRQISLFDGEVEWGRDDYDAEEVIYLNGNIAVNEEDFEGDAYLQFEEEDIVYEMQFDSELNTSDIDEDDTLEFNFLGESVEISDWDTDTITFTKGTEYAMREGDTITVDEKEITLTIVSDDRVMVTVDGTSKVVDEDETETVGGIDIKAEEVIYTEKSAGYATLVIGDEVSYEIEDGDEYDKDEIWVWKIDSDSIGLTLNQEYMELDDEFQPLKIGDELCLPNDYVCFVYEGLVDEDMEKLSFELDKYKGKNYTEVKGNFLKELEDYDKLYINASGIYDKDLEYLDNESIEIDNTELDLALSANGKWLKFIDSDGKLKLKINRTLEAIEEKGKGDISDFDDTYRTTYGITIDNPEDSVEDNEFEIKVPEEELFAEIVVTSKE